MLRGKNLLLLLNKRRRHPCVLSSCTEASALASTRNCRSLASHIPRSELANWVIHQPRPKLISDSFFKTPVVAACDMRATLSSKSWVGSLVVMLLVDPNRFCLLLFVRATNSRTQHGITAPPPKPLIATDVGGEALSRLSRLSGRCLGPKDRRPRFIGRSRDHMQGWKNKKGSVWSGSRLNISDLLP